MSLDISELYDRLYRFCYFRLREREQAQDIVQESFARYIDRYGKLDEKSAPVLYTIARNLCVDYFRGYHEEPGYDSTFAEELQTSENQADELIDKVIVQRALARMPGDEAEVLLLAIADGFSIQEAGKILGISRFAVYRRLQAGKKHFKEELRREGLEGRSVNSKTGRRGNEE